MQHLTHSRMTCAKTCLRAHYYSYELGIRKENSGNALRVGTAFHLGVDMLAQGRDIADVCAAIRTEYLMLPPWIMTPADEVEWHCECELAIALVCAYRWRWENDGIEVLATEQGFNIPLVNPATGQSSRNWDLAGKIDKIVKLPDGRLAVMEHKTTSDDLGTDSDYWARLRLDSQISLYVLAARELGYDVQTVLYDVARKPRHECSQICVTDSQGFKIVEDKDGNRIFKANGEPRQTADKDKGWLLKTRMETPNEYGQRVYKELYTNYDTYFVRQETPRLDADIEEFCHELWQQQQLLRDCQTNGRWFKNTSACLHPYKCHYFQICTSGINPAENLPTGYVKLEQVHPELEGAIA